jgi:hypothetical protein
MKEDSEMLTNSVNQRSYFITVGNIKMDFLNLGSRLINVKDIGLELGSFCLIAKKSYFFVLSKIEE